MDSDFIKVSSRKDVNERESDSKKKGHVEAPGSEVSKTFIRKSPRLQIKKTLSSCSQDIVRSYHSSSKYNLKSSKASLQRENFIYESFQKETKHQFPIRNGNNGVLENTTAVKSSTGVPSFRYHVQSKDGIQLVVDLNLKRSDWLKSIEKTVCKCKNHPKPEFESFRKEVESLGNRNKSNKSKVSSPDKTDASDASLHSYAQNDIPLKLNREFGETLLSVVEKEVITVSGSKRRWSKVDKKSDLEHENCLNTMMPDNCSHNTDCREIVAVSCKEIEFSDLNFSSNQKDSSCSGTKMVCSESLLTNTTEVNQEAGGNHNRSTIKNGKRINFAKGMKFSGRQENALVLLASDIGPKRKKPDHKSNHINGQSHERILRSTKLFGAQILERNGLFFRRSSRLFSK